MLLIILESIARKSRPNSPQTKRGANGKFLPKPLLFHLRHPNSKTNEPKFWQILSPKNSFAKTSSALKPHALPEYLEGRTPKEKHPFLFQKKFHPRQIRNARSVFSFGVAGVLASAWGFLRAYDLVSSHHALRACDIICFENRFELGTINTPIQNSTAFSKPEGGTREARPTDFLSLNPARNIPQRSSHSRTLEGGDSTKAPKSWGVIYKLRVAP